MTQSMKIQGVRLETQVTPSGGVQLVAATTPAAAPPKPFRGVPVNLNPFALVDTLAALGMIVPDKIAAAAPQGKAALRASGHRFLLKDVDAALAKANLSIEDRMRIKHAMTDNNILGR